MKFGLRKLIPVGISLLSLAAFVGSLSGSLAWWAYSTRVSVSYQGTSVTTSEQLQIGLKVSKVNATKATAIVNALETLGLEEDEDIADDDFRYVFSQAGGGLPAQAIKTYLETQGIYSYNELAPVTSKSYAAGDELHLYETLIYQHLDNTEVANKHKYTYIPFVFRILKLNAITGEDKYADGRKIYLSKVKVELNAANADSKIGEGLRVYFDNGGTTATDRFILNPSSTKTGSDAKTAVFGALDLNADFAYDTYPNGHAKAGQEIIYGEYDNEPTNFFTAPEPTQLSNLNGVELEEGFDLTRIEENRTTFLAAHKEGVTALMDYTGITKRYAEYKTLADIKPDDTQAELDGGQPLCVTGDETGNYLAELDATIWLEGWDHAVVDNAISHKFNLGLQFQIDLVR